MYYFILKSELKIYITTCSGAEAPTEQHEIFDGICPKPGGAHIHTSISRSKNLVPWP
jgi:hypothetical protein